MGSHARWTETAEDLSQDLARAAKLLDMGKMSAATGLSARTIQDSLTRDAITNPRNPRGAIDRPPYRIGNFPLWEKAQLDEYNRRAGLRNAEPDRIVSEAEARAEGLVSATQIAEVFSIHGQTARRWEQNHADYPAKVARLDRAGRPGRADHLRSLAEVLEWAATNNRAEVDTERIEAWLRENGYTLAPVRDEETGAEPEPAEVSA